MENRIDFSQLSLISKLSGETKKDTELLREMAEEAKRFLLSFHWCKAIQKGWFGWGVGGIAAVFLLEIDPAGADVDKLLWVVVGDLPPAYLVVDESPTPLDALRTYLKLMQEWIRAIRERKSTEECIPVNRAATRESADALETRLNFLKQEFLATKAHD